ncbi:allergen Tha p 1-like [Ostrinia furnacalis]|uniref:allergen Tha p 1-like n=1 Tax=Ostrinia furnacalis TaxID=93504 RepID=UPI00103C16DE|nr:allergen Tha p 1-like [Ostrinia furnacalis]
MKVLLLACMLACAGVVLGRRVPRAYTDIYDSIDINTVLSNRRLLVPYVLCVLEEGKCTPPGKELKSHIKEALETHCGQCTENQKRGSRQVIAHLINHEPEYWKKLTNKYDPTGKFTKMYENELRAHV